MDIREALRKFPIEEVRKELERRIEAEKASRPKPIISGSPVDNLLKVCEIHMDEIEIGEGTDSDSEHYIYEETMKFVYGPDVFDWVNRKMKEWN
jgi:hypothetical protein